MGERQPPGAPLEDRTGEQRRLAGLQRLNALARELLAEPSLDVLLVRLVDAARTLVAADFSALILLREGSTDEVAHFVYNAPRDLFPDHLPRVVGLLAVPVATAAVARIDDIRGHPAGVGIPVEHPPIAALLAAPVLLDGSVVGELAVANRVDGGRFDEIDEEVIVELAGHAATAVSLATARQAQARLDTTRQALLDVALHNIRTPLTVATGYLSTIRRHGDRLGEEDRNQAFEAIERAHLRIQELAEGALLDDPLRAGEQPVADDIDVAALIKEVGDELSGMTEGVTLTVSTAPEAPRSFCADRRLVRELLDNLVSNAMKHSKPGQMVRVTARREGASVRFDVTDRGPGIAPEEQGRVFEQFYRTQHSVEGDVPGTGLGLWIARRLAGLQGGAVGLTSRIGYGTTFWATFPLQPPRAAPGGGGEAPAR